MNKSKVATVTQTNQLSEPHRVRKKDIYTAYGKEHRRNKDETKEREREIHEN